MKFFRSSSTLIPARRGVRSLLQNAYLKGPYLRGGVSARPTPRALTFLQIFLKKGRLEPLEETLPEIRVNGGLCEQYPRRLKASRTRSGGATVKTTSSPQTVYESLSATFSYTDPGADIGEGNSCRGIFLSSHRCRDCSPQPPRRF
jgi:hypothetical protein